MLTMPTPAEPRVVAVAHAAAKPKTITYTVQPGDTLWSIAERFYGSGHSWARVFEANLGRVQMPGLIFPGQQLVIPDPSAPSPASMPGTLAGSAAQARALALPQPTGQPVAGVPWSIFSQPGGHAQAVAFAQALLRALGAPVTLGNLQMVYDWELSEGSGGWYNPLNGGDYNGMALSGEQYGGGANNYGSLAANVQAMAGILLHDTSYGYGAIVAALRNNNPAAARDALWASAWASSHYGEGAGWSDAPLPG